MPVTLYNMPASPPCGFVRSIAKHIGVELKVIDLDFKNKEHLRDDYLRVNPFHKVPAIDDNGFVVYESSAIAYYLLRKYAPESELYPDEIKARARIDQALAALSGTVHAVHPLAAVFFRPGFFLKKTPTAAEVIAYEENVLNNIQHLVGDKKYAIGDKLTLADLTIVSHLAMILEIDCVDRSKYPKLVSYYESLKAHLPYFEEIYRPVICYVKQHWASLQ